MTVEAVRARCRIARDTIEFDEGEPGRVLYAIVAGDTVQLNVYRGAVISIRVRRSRYATADSVRVGTPLARFLDRRVVTVEMGEGKEFLFAQNECGNSFGLSDPDYGKVSPPDVSSLRRLPASTIIDEIFVSGLPTDSRRNSCP